MQSMFGVLIWCKLYCVHAVKILMHKIDIKMKRKRVLFDLSVQGYVDEKTVQN